MDTVIERGQPALVEEVVGGEIGGENVVWGFGNIQFILKQEVQNSD